MAHRSTGGFRAWTAAVVVAGIGLTVLAGLPAATASADLGRYAAVAVPVTQQDWPMWRHDPLHQGVSAETALGAAAASKAVLKWSVNTGAKSYSSPAIVYNATLAKTLVYVGNQGGKMAAYDAATGAQVWAYQVAKAAGLSKEIETSPTVSKGVVYFGAGEYHEYALDATTGALICRSPSVGGIIAASSVVANPDGTGDVVFFGDGGPSGNASDGGHEWAMNAVGNPNGACTWKWSFDLFGNPPGNQTAISGTYSAPAFGRLADNTPVVVFGSTDPDDSIYAVNATTGSRIWRFQAVVASDSDVGAPATISPPGTNGFADGVVYETAKAGVTYALNLRTGMQLWQFNIRSIGKFNPAQSGASLVGNTIYMGYGGGVFALNATTGALVWKSATTAGVISSPAVSGAPGDQVAFVGDISGVIYAMDLTGKILLRYPSAALIFASAAVSAGRAFITSSNGTLYAFG